MPSKCVNSHAHGLTVKRECVVYWYSFSNPRTKCIHCDNCLSRFSFLTTFLFPWHL